MNDDYKELIDFLGKKFENIDKSFENIDGKFENIDKKFENIDGKFENIDGRFDAIERRLDNTATKDDMKDVTHQNKILYEEVQHRLELLAEGFNMHNEKNGLDKTEILDAITRLEKNSMLLQADILSLKEKV